MLDLMNKSRTPLQQALLEVRVAENQLNESTEETFDFICYKLISAEKRYQYELRKQMSGG